MPQQLQSYAETPHTAWVKVDYLSVTMPRISASGSHQTDIDAALTASSHPVVPYFVTACLQRLQWQQGGGRKGHTNSLVNKKTGIRLWYGGGLHVSVMEFSGRGCDYLRTFSGDKEIASLSAECCTRIDIAVDVACPISVLDVQNQGVSPRLRSKSFVTSPTGDTLYLGSPTSERFARIYRYAAPHPRAAYLRLEVVSRRKHARSVCEAVKAVGLGAPSASLLATLKLGHKQLQAFSSPSIAVTPMANRREAAKRVMWMLKQVAPALLDMHASGELDAREFWRDHIEPNL